MLVGLFVGKRESRPWVASDEPWSLIGRFLPDPAPKLVAGRPRMPDSPALCGILFVLHTGDPVKVPAAGDGLRFGHDMLASACGLERGRRLGPAPRCVVGKAASGQTAGPIADGDRLLPCAGRSARPGSGPSPVDRARPGSKHRTLVDGQGHPTRDVSDRRKPQRRLPADALPETKIPSVPGLAGRPRRRPDVVSDHGVNVRPRTTSHLMFSSPPPWRAGLSISGSR